MRLTPIGIIHSPFTTREGMPIQPTGARDVRGEVVIDREYEEGLSDIEGFSHLILLYLFHRSDGYELMVKPFLDTQRRGLFATRAPRRPNPIGLSVVRLAGRRNNVLDITGVDVLDGTPLLDVKPHVPAFDAPEKVRIGWMRESVRNADSVTADERFSVQSGRDGI